MENIRKFTKKVLKDEKSMDSLIIYKNGRGFEVNKKNDEVFDVRSISKTVLAIACGILIEKSDNNFNEDTLIYPIIKKKINLTNKKNLNYLTEVKVKHLLTHTTGYRDLLLMSKDLNPKDYYGLFDYIINYPIYYKPGSHFLYSNAGYYLLAIVMEEYLGYDLYRFIEKNLLSPLDISDASWGRYGEYLAGATKIYLSSDDMLNIGKLLINNGKFYGKQIVNSDWIRKMTFPLFKNTNETDRDYLSEDNYGYGIWISDKDIIFASGTGGQLIVLDKKLGIIIVTTNSGSDNKGYIIKQNIDNIVASLHER